MCDLRITLPCLLNPWPSGIGPSVGAPVVVISVVCWGTCGRIKCHETIIMMTHVMS